MAHRAPVGGSSDNLLDDRLIPRTEEIPSSPRPGNYVVIDAMHFSNTVLELLANGASHIHVTEARGDEPAYKRNNPQAVIGGGSTQEYEPVEGYDFFNSPSYVQRLDVAGRPVAMTSSNGGRAVNRLRTDGGEGVDIFVGSTMNARALGRFLRAQDEPTRLVSAGSNGDIAVEDHIGALLISRYLDEIPVAATEMAVFRHQLQRAKGAEYIDRHPLRRRDVLDYTLALNSRQIIPKLEGDSLVRAREQFDVPVAEEQAAD